MLILVEPPETELSRAPAPERWRDEYLALAAVAFAIAVSLLGLALVVLEATPEPPPHVGQLKLA